MAPPGAPLRGAPERLPGPHGGRVNFGNPGAPLEGFFPRAGWGSSGRDPEKHELPPPAQGAIKSRVIPDAVPVPEKPIDGSEGAWRMPKT